MLGKLKYILMLVVLFIGCRTQELNYPPRIYGYEIIVFGQPQYGELIYVGGDRVITNYGYIGNFWILKKIE